MSKLEDALKSIDADFGGGSVMRLGETSAQRHSVISSGSLALDRALGIGGYPRGRVVEIFGPESSGKSTLCLHAAANAQRAGGNVFYLDVENSLDLEYAQALGVNTDELLVSQPETGEQGLEILDRIINTGEVALVVVDSIAALVPQAEISGDYADRHVGLHARLLSQAMRKLTGPLNRTGTLSIWVNQLRANIGAMGYGPTETTTGGRAVKFFASQRLDVRRIATEKSGDEATGNRTRIKIVKNKCAKPATIAEVTIRYGEGISREIELLDLGIEQKIVQKSGAWFKYGDAQLGQGQAKAMQFLIDNPEVADEIEGKIREGLGEELDG